MPSEDELIIWVKLVEANGTGGDFPAQGKNSNGKGDEKYEKQSGERNNSAMAYVNAKFSESSQTVGDPFF